MTHDTKQRLQQNFPVIPTGNEYRKQLGTTVVCVATPETRGNRATAHNLPLTNVAGDIEAPLPTTTAEQE